MILVEALAIVSAGILVGAPLAFWTARLVESAVGEPIGGAPNGLSALAMILISGIAALLPAHPASRIDPMIALRYE